MNHFLFFLLPTWESLNQFQLIHFPHSDCTVTQATHNIHLFSFHSMDTLQGRHILVIHKEQYQWLWWVNKLFFFSILIFLIGNMNKIGFLIESKVKVKKKKNLCTKGNFGKWLSSANELEVLAFLKEMHFSKNFFFFFFCKN